MGPGAVPRSPAELRPKARPGGREGARGQPEMLGPARVMVMRTTQRRSLIMAAR